MDLISFFLSWTVSLCILLHYRMILITHIIIASNFVFMIHLYIYTFNYTHLQLIPCGKSMKEVMGGTGEGRGPLGGSERWMKDDWVMNKAKMIITKSSFL